MSETAFIYGLIDPRTEELRYVGKTINTKTRLASHLREYSRGKINHKSTWIQGVLNAGLKPKLIILAQIDISNWQEMEVEIIRRAKEKGFRLTNMVPGGSGGAVFGRKLSAETRIKMSKSLMGRKSVWADSGPPQKSIDAMLLGRQGKSPRKGMKNTPEQNRKIGDANRIALKGRSVSEAQRQNLVRASKIRWARDKKCAS